MTILGIEASGNVGSVAVIKDGVLIGEYTINNKKTHSQTLLPMIDELLKRADIKLSDIDAFAVSKGPGSFTGLRIGSATAKGLAAALSKPIVSVGTLDGLAYNCYGSDKVICPIMDARRGQVYTGIYEFEKSSNYPYEYKLCELCANDAMPIEEVISKVNSIGRETIFLGDGVDVFCDVLKDNVSVPFSFEGAGNRLQRASSVALYGEYLVSIGKTESAEEHAPIYLRVSQAERELMEKQGKNDL